MSATYDPRTHKVVPKDYTVFPWAQPLAVAQRLRERHALTCSDVADLTEEQHKPPRIDEPALGSHVTADNPDGTRGEFVRVGTRHWSEIGNGSGWEWSDLRNPVLVREGLS